MARRPDGLQKALAPLFGDARLEFLPDFQVEVVDAGVGPIHHRATAHHRTTGPVVAMTISQLLSRPRCRRCFSEQVSRFFKAANPLLGLVLEAAQLCGDLERYLGGAEDESATSLLRNAATTATALKLLADRTPRDLLGPLIAELVRLARAVRTQARARDAEQLVTFTAELLGASLDQLDTAATLVAFAGAARGRWAEQVVAAFGVPAPKGTVVLAPRFVVDYLLQHIFDHTARATTASAQGVSTAEVETAAHLWDPSSPDLATICAALAGARGALAPIAAEL